MATQLRKKAQAEKAPPPSYSGSGFGTRTGPKRKIPTFAIRPSGKELRQRVEEYRNAVQKTEYGAALSRFLARLEEAGDTDRFMAASVVEKKYYLESNLKKKFSHSEYTRITKAVQESFGIDFSAVPLNAMSLTDARNRQTLYEYVRKHKPSKENIYRFGKFIEIVLEKKNRTLDDFVALPLFEQEQQVNEAIKKEGLLRQVKSTLKVALNETIFVEKAKRLSDEIDQRLVTGFRDKLMLKENGVPAKRVTQMIYDLRFMLRQLESLKMTGAQFHALDLDERAATLKKLVTEQRPLRKLRYMAKLLDIAVEDDPETALPMTAEVFQEQSLELARPDFEGQAQPDDLDGAQLLLNFWLDAAEEARGAGGGIAEEGGASIAAASPLSLGADDLANEPEAMNLRNLNDYQAVPARRYTNARMLKIRNDAAEYLKNPLCLFRMAGNKARLLKHPALAEPIFAAINNRNFKRFYDGFAGTGAVSAYLQALGAFPDGSVINELVPLRHIDILQSLTNPHEVEAAMRRYGDAIRKLCCTLLENRDMDEELSMASVEEWEQRVNKADVEGFNAVQRARIEPFILDYLMDELEKLWPQGGDIANTPETAALNKLLQMNTLWNTPVSVVRPDGETKPWLHRGGFVFNMLGSYADQLASRGRMRVLEMIDRSASDMHTMSERLKGAQVTRRDGFNYEGLLEPGDVLFLDPPYLLKSNQKTSDSMLYKPGQLREYAVENWDEIAGHLEQEAWAKDVPIIITNRYNDQLRVMLENRGWRVSDKIKSANLGMSEMVITNFDWESGVAAIRKRGRSDHFARLAAAHGGRLTSLDCEQLDGGAARQRGVVIGDYFYAQSGKDGAQETDIARFEPARVRTTRGARTIIDEDTSTWIRSADQTGLPGLPHSAIDAEEGHAKSGKRRRLD
jgi:site-specific DNA-adenine methylase